MLTGGCGIGGQREDLSQSPERYDSTVDGQEMSQEGEEHIKIKAQFTLVHH